MSDNNNGKRKTWIQKLKHLVTVTESQAIEEEKAKEKPNNNGRDENKTAESPNVIEGVFNNSNSKVKNTAEKPALKLIEKNDAVKQKAKTAPAEEQIKKEEVPEDKEGAEKILNEVSKAYENQSVNYNKEDSLKPLSQRHAEITGNNQIVPPQNTDENIKTEEKKLLDKKENLKSETDNNADADDKSKSSDKKPKAKNQQAKQQTDKPESENGKGKKDAQQIKTDGIKAQNDSGAVKKHKKHTFISFIQALVVLGQTLNAKPDEYSPDEVESLKEYEPEKSENPVLNKTEKAKGESLADIIEENRRIVAQDEQDLKENMPTEEKNLKAGKKDESRKQSADNKFVKVKRTKGEIIIDGDSLPMYAYEDKSPRINVEIGKLSPVLLKEYEAYVEPEQLEAKKAQQAEMREQRKKNPVEVITEATTLFSDNISAAAPKDTDINKGEEKNHESAKAEEEKTDKNKEDVKQDKKEKKQRKSIKEALFGDFEEEADYSVFTSPDNETTETIDDYESPSDAKAVRAEINLNIRKLFFRSLIVGIIFILTLLISVIQRVIPDVLASAIPNVDIMFCIINFLFLIAAAAVSSVTIKNGFSPLIGFRGNSDTAVAVAAVAAILQCITSFFDSRAFFMGWQNLYALLVIFALLLNSIGKMWIILRIKENFRFVSSESRRYAVKIFNDEKKAEEMIADTNAEEPVVAFQRRTKFLKNFLRLSYAPDPSEKIASKFAPVCVTCAVVVAIIHGIIYQSISGAISSLALVACVGIPVCSLLSVNIPMRMLCKDALKRDAMIVGYPAVKQFCDTSAIIVDSRELYPRTAVELISVKPFMSYNLEQAVLNAAAVMKIANTSMTYVFEDIIRGRSDTLPVVESVKYEEGRGLVGWVSGERILIGKRELLIKYGVEPPSLDFEEPYIIDDKQITYLANAGQLIAMFVTDYTPDSKLVQEIQRLDSNGVSILIRTADSNITPERIARDFQIHSRSLKILPNSLGNICKDEISIKEEESRAYIATRGKLSSLSRAISGCIKIKRNISLAIAVQFVAVVLGIIIASAVAILAGVDSFGVIELLIYMVFWAVASIVVPLIQKP